MLDFNIKNALLLACVMFTVAIVITVFVGWGVGWFGLDVVLNFASIALMCTGPFFQLFWFGPKPFPKMSYGVRVAGFGLTYLVVLVGCALIGGWMPEGESAAPAWIWFIGIYLVILAALSIFFDRKYKKEAGSYQAALDAYKRRLK